MIKSYKVRLEPNNKQRSRLIQFAGASRFAYNWALAKQIENHELGKQFISDCDLRRIFTEFEKKNPWLYEISNDVTKQAIKDAVVAFRNFFNKQSGFPKFKTRKRNKPSFYRDCFKFKVTDTHVKIEKISNSMKSNRKKLNLVKLSERGRIPKDLSYKNPRISFNGIDWFVSVGVEVPDKETASKKDGVGIDFGIKDLAICSDGNIYENINKTKRVRKIEKRRKRIQRSISRKYEYNKKGNKFVKTNNIKKQEKHLLKINHRLRDIRLDNLHKVTSEIVDRNPRFIVLEDLNVSGILKNKNLARATQEQSLRKLRTMLEYKCVNNNIDLIVANRFYPSSKRCSHCGAIKQDLKLKDRIYHCDNCGISVDRDYNASINLYLLGCSTDSSSGINACGVSHQTEVTNVNRDTLKQEVNKESSDRLL